jgi:hypothetical protein
MGVFAGAAGTDARAVAPLCSGGRVGVEVAVALGDIGASPSACRALNTHPESVPAEMPSSRDAALAPTSRARFVAAAFSASVNVLGLDLAMMTSPALPETRTGCPGLSGQLRVVRVRQEHVALARRVLHPFGASS